MQATLMMSRAVAGTIGAAALLLARAAQAALQDRDLNGDKVVDAFYDTDLDISWLRDTNVSGAMNWDTAVAWADNFSFSKCNDWRLPTSDTCYGDNCAGSKMGHLWYTVAVVPEQQTYALLLLGLTGLAALTRRRPR